MKHQKLKILCAAAVVILVVDRMIQGRYLTPAQFHDASQHQLHQPRRGEYILDSANATFVPPSGSIKFFCVPWSIDTDEWWTHHPEWDIAAENDLFTCFRKTNSSVWKRVYENQFHNNCSKVFTRKMWNSGFGADMDNVVLGLQNGMEQSVPVSMLSLEPRPWWHYSANKADGSNATCAARDMTCYFLPTTNCKPTLDKRKVDKEAIRLVRKHVKDFLAVYYFVTRQRQWLRKQVYDYTEAVAAKLSSSCSVVHVRRTDVVLHGSESRRYFPISDYVNLLPSTNDTVLLLTDDANAIDEALEFHPHIRWVYLDRPRHRGTSGGWEQQVPSKDPKSEVIIILSILKLVARCNVFVHSRSGFANMISRIMGPNATKFQVDSNISEVFHRNNSQSVAELEKLLEEKRKAKAP